MKSMKQKRKNRSRKVDVCDPNCAHETVESHGIFNSIQSAKAETI